MAAIADLVRDFILTSGEITGYQPAAFRDDAMTPFKTLSAKILQSMTSSQGADDLISNDAVTLYFYTQANPTGAQIKTCMEDAEKVKKYLLRNKSGNDGKIFNFTVISGVDGPYFDGQGRKAYGLVVRVSSNSLC